MVSLLLLLVTLASCSNQSTTPAALAPVTALPPTAAPTLAATTPPATSQPTATAIPTATPQRSPAPGPTPTQQPTPANNVAPAAPAPSTYPFDGAFADFWNRNGGLTRFGYALSPAVRDPTSPDLIVQYFERARFEYHAEAPARYRVLLALLGATALGDRPERRAPANACTGECTTFTETGHSLRGTFRRYWLTNGGLPVFGFPLTEELREVNAADGRSYTVQYFERARFELHPENAGSDYEVLLGHLGREALSRRSDLASLPSVQVPNYPPGKVIVLDPGHDRTTGGALGLEYQDTLRTALAIKTRLEARGYTVYLTRPDNATILNSDPALLPADPRGYDAGYLEGYAHATKILSFKPDLAISIHYNAAPSGPGGGSATYYSVAGGPQNRRLATLIQDELRLALRDRGYTPPYSRVDEDLAIGKTYGGLATLGNVADRNGTSLRNRMVGLPIVLTEALFETNPTERALITDDATIARLADGYARAIDAFFNGP